MEFSRWLDQGYGRVTLAAKAMRVNPPFVSKIKAGKKSMPEKHAPTIERISGGAVTCEEMCPHVEWHVLRNSARALPGSGPCTEIQITAAPEAANDAALDAPGRA